MALFQSSIAKRLITPTRPLSAGAVHCSRADFTFAAAFTFATDQLELAVLPAFSTIVDAILIGAVTGTVVADVGLMSGEVGDAINARTVGNELFDNTDVAAAVTRMTLATGFNIAPVGYDRAIGVTLSANVTAGAAKKISLLLFYQM